MKEHCNARNIENRKGKIPNTDQGRVVEGLRCDQHLNLIICMFVTFLKMFREHKTLLFVNAFLMMS